MVHWPAYAVGVVVTLLVAMAVDYVEFGGTFGFFELIAVIAQVFAALAAAVALWLNRLDRIERDAPHVVIGADPEYSLRNVGKGAALGVSIYSPALVVRFEVEGRELASDQDRGLYGDFIEVVDERESLPASRYWRLVRPHLMSLVGQHLKRDRSAIEAEFRHTVVLSYSDRVSAARYRERFTVNGKATVSLKRNDLPWSHKGNLRVSNERIQFVTPLGRKRDLLRPLFDRG